MFLKIAPDLSDAQLDDIVALVADTGIDGVIATNTTISRDGLKTPGKKVEAIGAGGLSGAPVRERSTEVVRYLRHRGDFAIIGVGGIEDGASAREKVDAGADLVQVYSGMVYTGRASCATACPACAEPASPIDRTAVRHVEPDALFRAVHGGCLVGHRARGAGSIAPARHTSGCGPSLRPSGGDACRTP